MSQSNNCVVLEFIKNNGRSYKPGSDLHLELRRNYVGCSELYKAINTLNMAKTVIKNKINAQGLNVLPVTHGVHFEDNCEEYLKYLLKNERIYKAPGSITNSKLPNIACSPDALGYLNISNFEKYKKLKKGIEYVSIPYNSPMLEELISAFSSSPNCKLGENNLQLGEKEVPCLFEYKSPFSRKLKDGYISLDYEYQIQGGMQVIDMCEYACFFESVFKLCSIGQLFGTWCYDMNYTLYECLEEATELAKGVKLYFLKPEFFNRKDINSRLVNMLDDFNNPVYEQFGIDFGTHDYFKSFFVGLNESMFYSINLPMYFRQDGQFVSKSGDILNKESITNLIQEHTSTAGYLGYACWKLYDYQIIIEKRKNIITEKELARCESIMACIQIIDDPSQIDLLNLKDNKIVL